MPDLHPPALLIAVILALCGSPDVRAAALRQPDREFAARVWRTQDGLPENRVQAISGTPDGYLWIGTPGGLVRFDGARFAVYSRTNTPAFVDDSVTVLYTSRDGVLWVGTDGGGLLRLKDGEFRSYGQREGLTDSFIRAIYQDSRGTVWVATAHGLFHLEGQKFVRMAEPHELPVSVFWALSQQDSGLWAQSTLGWYLIDGNKLTGPPVRKLPDSGDEPGCVAPTLPKRAAATGTVAPPSYRDHNGDLWIGGIGDGLTRVRGCVVTQWRAPDLVPGNTVLSIFEDLEHSIWVGTEDGLLRLSRSTVTTLNAHDGFDDNYIFNVYQDQTRTLWVTTLTGQVYRLVDGKISRFPLPPEIGNPRILTIFRDSHGTLWLGTSNRGFIGLSNGHVMKYSMKDGLRSDAINNFFEDRAGRLWIATSSGLTLWDRKNIFRNYYLEEGLTYGHVRVIAQDADGDLLVGTDGGLNRVHDDRIVADPLLARLGREKVTSIYVDSNRSIWLGTRGDGLIRIGGGKIARLTTDAGLLSKSIYQLLGDAGGRLWMSSPAGIFSASINDLNAVADGRTPSVAVSAYGIADGMETTQMSGVSQPAGAHMPDGRLAFPSVKGLVIVDPNRTRIEKPSPVHIESVMLDDSPVPLRGGDLVVEAGHRTLQIDFTAPSLLSPERLSFRYRLRNFSDSWSVATSPRTAQYSNLPPGRYVFEVEAQDGAIPGSVSHAEIVLTWQAHFYRTWWFYSIVGLALGAACWIAFRSYENQQKMRYAVRLSERTRIARDMHDTVIQGCVGASTLLEAAAGLAGPETASVMQFLDRARIQLRLTLDEARQALTDLRHDSFADGLGGALQDLARGVSQESSVPVEVKIEGTRLALPESLNRNMLLVAREAIRNSVAHACPARIEVSLSFAAAQLSLEIRDDGCGFAAGRPEFSPTDHFGITGMRERVEQLGGSFSLRSVPGEGTSVNASLPLTPVVGIAV